MITYNDFDIQCLEYINNILRKLGAEIPEDEEVWEKAREYAEIPCFENILIELSFQKLESAIATKYPNEFEEMEIESRVNCADSSFIVNGTSIINLDDIDEVLKEIREEMDNNGPNL
jgi:hypothetical protein